MSLAPGCDFEDDDKAEEDDGAFAVDSMRSKKSGFGTLACSAIGAHGPFISSFPRSLEAALEEFTSDRRRPFLRLRFGSPTSDLGGPMGAE